MSEVKLNKIYGGEMFKWVWKFVDGEFKIKITEISDLLPIYKNMFISSNGITFRRNGALGFVDDIFDLPEIDFEETNYYDGEEKDRLHKGLLEFHEFCVKTYGNKVEEVQEISPQQQCHDNSINSLKGFLKDRFNQLLGYPYEIKKVMLEDFLKNLVEEIDEF